MSDAGSCSTCEDRRNRTITAPAANAPGSISTRSLSTSSNSSDKIVEHVKYLLEDTCDNARSASLVHSQGNDPLALMYYGMCMNSLKYIGKISNEAKYETGRGTEQMVWWDRVVESVGHRVSELSKKLEHLLHNINSSSSSSSSSETGGGGDEVVHALAVDLDPTTTTTTSFPPGSPLSSIGDPLADSPRTTTTTTKQGVSTGTAETSAVTLMANVIGRQSIRHDFSQNVVSPIMMRNLFPPMVRSVVVRGPAHSGKTFVMQSVVEDVLRLKPDAWHLELPVDPLHSSSSSSPQEIVHSVQEKARTSEGILTASRVDLNKEFYGNLVQLLAAADVTHSVAFLMTKDELNAGEEAATGEGFLGAATAGDVRSVHMSGKGSLHESEAPDVLKQIVNTHLTRVFSTNLRGGELSHLSKASELTERDLANLARNMVRDNSTINHFVNHANQALSAMATRSQALDSYFASDLFGPSTDSSTANSTNRFASTLHRPSKHKAERLFYVNRAPNASPLVLQFAEEISGGVGGFGGGGGDPPRRSFKYTHITNSNPFYSTLLYEFPGDELWIRSTDDSSQLFAMFPVIATSASERWFVECMVPKLSCGQCAAWLRSLEGVSSGGGQEKDTTSSPHMVEYDQDTWWDNATMIVSGSGDQVQVARLTGPSFSSPTWRSLVSRLRAEPANLHRDSVFYSSPDVTVYQVSSSFEHKETQPSYSQVPIENWAELVSFDLRIEDFVYAIHQTHHSNSTTSSTTTITTPQTSPLDAKLITTTTITPPTAPLDTELITTTTEPSLSPLSPSPSPSPSLPPPVPEAVSSSSSPVLFEATYNDDKNLIVQASTNENTGDGNLDDWSRSTTSYIPYDGTTFSDSQDSASTYHLSGGDPSPRSSSSRRQAKNKTQKRKSSVGEASSSRSSRSSSRRSSSRRRSGGGRRQLHQKTGSNRSSKSPSHGGSSSRSRSSSSTGAGGGSSSSSSSYSMSSSSSRRKIAGPIVVRPAPKKSSLRKSSRRSSSPKNS